MHLDHVVIKVAHRVTVGEHLDGLAQPVQFTGGHDIGDMFAVGDHGHGLAVFGAAHGLGPGRRLLGVDAGPSFDYTMYLPTDKMLADLAAERAR